MFRRSSVILALVAVFGVVLTVPAGLAAEKKKTHTVDSAVQAAAVAATSNGGAVVAGSVRDPAFGQGATVYRTTPAAGGVQNSTFTAFFAAGTYKGTASVRSTPQPDGSIRLDGTGRITGGTGRYRGAKGRFTISAGTILPDGSIAFTAKGTVRY